LRARRLNGYGAFDERLVDGCGTDGAVISGPDKVAVPCGEPVGGEARVCTTGVQKPGIIVNREQSDIISVFI
jgi:hypothetical protein